MKEFFLKIKLFFKNNKPEKSETSEVPSMSEMPNYYLTALNEVGQKEIKGNAHNARIIEYHKATDLRASQDEVAWCSSFVNWCFLKNGIKGTNKANARSFLKWGMTVVVPQKGDVVIFWRGSKSAAEGHVGFFVEEDSNSILVLGGNQGDEVSFKHYPKSQLLGYRRLIA